MSQGVFWLFSFLLIIPALTLHEWAHAWMANRLGDPTARMLGRISINPIRHIDPIGTVLVPIALLVLSSGAFTFGWAKPVPFNPRYLKDPKRDTALIGIAGPAMNVILAVGTAIVLLVMMLAVPNLIVEFSTQQAGLITGLTAFGVVLARFCYINLVLCFFNLLPIPPFDGSRIVQKFLRGNARHWYGQLERYGMFIVFGLIFLVPMLTGFNPIGLYFSVTVQPIFEFMTRIPVNFLFF
jgi:Zn-dependent protease